MQYMVAVTRKSTNYLSPFLA